MKTLILFKFILILEKIFFAGESSLKRKRKHLEKCPIVNFEQTKGLFLTLISLWICLLIALPHSEALKVHVCIFIFSLTASDEKKSLWNGISKSYRNSMPGLMWLIRLRKNPGRKKFNWDPERQLSSFMNGRAAAAAAIATAAIVSCPGERPTGSRADWPVAL